MGKFLDRLQHAWNLFTNPEYRDYGRYESSSDRPDRVRLTLNTERTQLAAMSLRIAIDVAQITYRHAQLDQNESYTGTVDSGLNRCLNVEANLDQEAEAFIRDLVLSLCDEGVVAVVPTDTTINPQVSEAYDIKTLRVAKIISWEPDRVKVDIYNQRTGRHEQLWCDKSSTAIIDNPLYTVMNNPNSTLRRLTRKLALLDLIDEQSASGKLDLIFQLPYTIRGDNKAQIVEKRRTDLEKQLTGSKYGIAYVDATERITQLNRPAENNLLAQIEILSAQVYNEIGIAKEVIDGNADTHVMLNYDNRVVEPIAAAIVNEMTRKFLSKTAITQGKRIIYIRDPFKRMAVDQIAEIADKFRRNEIMSSNELRQKVGLIPVTDPDADELRNPNLNKPVASVEGVENQPSTKNEVADQNETG